jgi:D-tyrosyl-tRNA(Tyr) deacylase
MRAVVQRVSYARVDVADETISEIEHGLVVLICAMDDEEPDLSAWANRLCRLRVFSDEDGKMNRSLLDTGGSLLLVSQFTLSADMKKGLRPSFGRASAPTLAQSQIAALADSCSELGVPTQTGAFGADMAVHLTNDGPVTIWIDKP